MSDNFTGAEKQHILQEQGGNSMMNRKKKLTAWFLACVMLCGMFVGIPASAEEPVTGFVMSMDARWDYDEEQECELITMPESSYSRLENWAENENQIVVSFADANEGTLEYLEWEDIVVERKVGEEWQDVTESIPCSELWNLTGDTVAYEISLEEVAFGTVDIYRFYKSGNSEENVELHYEAKKFGFYATQDDDGTGYLNNFYYSNDEKSNNTFYLLPYNKESYNKELGEEELTSLILDADDVPFVVSYWNDENGEVVIESNDEAFADYVSVELIEKEGEEEFLGYAVTVSEKTVSAFRDFNLTFRGLEKWHQYNESGIPITDDGEYVYDEYERECSVYIDTYPETEHLLVHGEECSIGTDMNTIRYDEEGNPAGETRYLVDCAINKHGDRYVEKYYTTSEFTVYRIEKGNEGTEDQYEVKIPVEEEIIVDVEDEKGNNSLYFTIEEEGTYALCLNEGTQDEHLIYFDAYPNAWNEFYLTPDGDTNPIWDFATNGKEDSTTFYFIVKDMENLSLEDIAFDAYVDEEKVEEDAEKDYFITQEVTDPEDETKKVYKIEVKAQRGFELVVDTKLSDGAHTWGKTNSIWIAYKETGLVLGDPVWEEGLTGAVHEGSYTKQKMGEIYSVCWLYLGTTEDGESYVPLDSSAFDEESQDRVSINGSTDYIVLNQEQWPMSDEQDTVIVNESLAVDGIYGFYVKDDLTISYGEDSVTVAKQLPAIGFYKENKATFDNYVTDEYLMSKTEMFEGMDIYVLPREDVKTYSYTLDTIDKTILINNEEFVYTHISDDEHPAGYYQSASSFTTPIKISVEKCAGSFLRLRGEINWDEGEPELLEKYLGLSYENEDAVILEDNSPHEGFGGCLISESDYNVSQWWQMSGDVYYWVHGKTIQDVVDQLSEVAKKGEVTVDGKTYPIGMTDYIWLNTSYFKYSEDFANSTQYVVTPSNIKGIIMQAGAEAPYALYNDGETKGYYHVQEWTDGEDVLLLTQTPIDNNYYPVEELPDKQAVEQKADYIVSDYEDVWTLEELKNANYEPIVDEFDDPLNTYPVYLPNLFVDATVEVKMIGNFGDAEADKQVQLGFYEGSTNKSIINGKEFSAANIGDKPVVVGDEENRVTVTVTEFKASTECSKAPINGENCEVSLGGKNADLRDKIDIYQKGDDDYADAKKLAEGEELKVKLDVNEAKADDTEAKKVAEQVEKDCGKDKTKPSKVQYLDIDLKYQVGERDPKAVTETMEEVDITMDIPDSFRQMDKHAKKRHYKVYRYHDGKVDMLVAEFDKEKNKLHFKTDKFSTYALVAEDVAPVSIEVTTSPVKLSYIEGEMFDATGMTISLVYSDGTKETITDYTVSVTKALALTDKEVMVMYDGFSVQFPISVIAKQEVKPGEEPKDDEQAVLPEIGKAVETKNGTCKVTAIGLEGAVEVTFTPSKTNKKAKNAKIDKTVVIDGKEYAVTAVAAGAFSGNTKMTSISIPASVTKIGNNAFKGCTNLKKITIPKNVTEVGNNAFYNCKKMTKLTIKGTSLTKIGVGAFRKCSSLKSVTIPKNVTEIGKDAFRDCKKLSKVTIKGTKIKKIGKNAFKNIAKKSTIKVPKSKKAAYKSLLKKAGYKSTIK